MHLWASGREHFIVIFSFPQYLLRSAIAVPSPVSLEYLSDSKLIPSDIQAFLLSVRSSGFVSTGLTGTTILRSLPQSLRTGLKSGGSVGSVLERAWYLIIRNRWNVSAFTMTYWIPGKPLATKRAESGTSACSRLGVEIMVGTETELNDVSFGSVSVK